MGHWIELKPEGAGPIRAWRADPEGRPLGGIVVIQEIFGVNHHIRSVCDRLAGAGYVAGDFRHDSYMTETAVLSAEAMADAGIVDEGLKYAFDRENPMLEGQTPCDPTSRASSP